MMEAPSPDAAMPGDDETPMRIAGGGFSAVISPMGAELQHLATDDGQALLHDGRSFWTGRSPILFPIVGALREGEYRWQGQSYRLPRHGFARTRPFTPIAHTADRAVLRLRDDAATRAVYPFAFTLDLDYLLDARGLTMTATVTNPGSEPLPASIGFHPAFRWPLPFGGARGDHVLIFAEEEPEALSVITEDGLIGDQDRPTPLDGRRMAIDDALFTDDALVWPHVRSRSLIFGVPGHTGLAIAFPQAETLAIWTKPDAPYLCVEPWIGHADPAGFTGDLGEKPGMRTPDPGAGFALSMTIALAEVPRDDG